MSSNVIENIAEELDPPTWLNKDFILEVLQHCEKRQEIELKELRILPASAKNDHYASVMFRVVVKYTLYNQIKEKSLILKTMPEAEGHKKEFLKDSNIFETEISMYTQVIPKFEEILTAAGDNTKFGPPCLYHSLSPKKLIIFEDMIPHGYTVLSKRQTNFEESKAVYTKIAKWHAISYKLNLEQPDFFHNFRTNIFVELNWRDSEFFKDGITNFIEMLDEHADLHQYKQYFQPLESTILDYVEKTFSEYTTNPQSSAYYVLCHADFHHRNMLFKYDQGTSNFLDVMLIDYQMCNVGPIVNDIICSIYMLIDEKQRLESLNELLYIYFSTFQETLLKIGFKGTMPKIIEFRKQLMNHRHYELFILTSFLPLLYATYGNEHDLADLLTSKEKRKLIFKSPVYLDEVRKLLPRYLHLGYLENL